MAEIHSLPRLTRRQMLATTATAAITLPGTAQARQATPVASPDGPHLLVEPTIPRYDDPFQVAVDRHRGHHPFHADRHWQSGVPGRGDMGGQ